MNGTNKGCMAARYLAAAPANNPERRILYAALGFERSQLTVQV